MGGVNPLESYFRNNESRLIHKWLHYFDIDHRHFERFRGRPGRRSDWKKAMVRLAEGQSIDLTAGPA